jgi:hypothetical protein
VLDVLTVDHYPQAEHPLGDDEQVLEARHVGGQGVPVTRACPRWPRAPR